MILFQWPPAPTPSVGPIEFLLDGSSQQVSLDTVTPANSKPLPVAPINSSGVVIDPATEAKQDDILTALAGSNTFLNEIDIKLDAQATSALQLLGNASLASIDGKVLTDTQLRASPVPVSVSSSALPTGAATSALQTSGNASLTSIDGKTPALVSGRVPVDGSGVTQPISAASLPLPSGAATSANQSAEQTLIGAVTETAPASDTASSGLNGRLQRIAQRLTSLIAQIPATLGQKTMANSLAVTIASDQTVLKTSVGTGAAQADSGSINNSTQGASASTVTAPANAIGFILAADDDNTDAIYWAIGATASATSGQRMAPGRDSGFVPCGANISIFGAATTPRYNIQWFTRS